ncbi:hypothetical protein KG112_08175 [Nocardioides sp. zg-ZUI104]|uniref:hypothetical protein n=1 Tax=Nocardioides faecalis TaxID=2803858 RepID=UPI001BCE3EB9|nr:hypothetical protein [Nocardioides faecalis]MBS4752783.1 hypothetical protein [Nocardioides faecalis]
MSNTHDTDDTVPTTAAALNDPDELERFLAAYRPKDVEAAIWARVRQSAAALVMRAGEPTRLRVEKDIQLLGAVVAHLVDRGRETTLDEALADRTLLSFDTSLTASAKTRENKRGIARRLQAAHRGLPWREGRRKDGERVQALVSHDAVDDLQQLMRAAALVAGDDEAAAFIAAVGAARPRRCAGSEVPAVDEATWQRARRFADAQGRPITRRWLHAVLTHEVLTQDAPVAVLIARYGLSRRDLDLGLTRAATLPTAPTSTHHDLLRGAR